MPFVSLRQRHGTPYLLTICNLKLLILLDVIKDLLLSVDLSRPLAPIPNAPWFSSETLALYKSLTYLLTYLTSGTSAYVPGLRLAMGNGYATRLSVIRYTFGVYHRCKNVFYVYILRTDDRPTEDLPRILENFKRPYLGNGSSDRLRVWFYVGFSGTADRMDLPPVRPNPRSWKISNNYISGMGYPIHFHELQSGFGGIYYRENNERGWGVIRLVTI